ncbi:uncharacterized protein EI97DRAFT_497777 [Westerdykella ornata]|uniref:C3H1-type domain-containing protein n=1 Tax=Westerdykella ornata TaxID=318751 RepID=A0A6A6JZ23_WESOR|nr:uncharacterized protein EI97DRAFT_497777 [Westerdykella ornata]KAF2281098.1 hypothetical protein EI97DRAFT_497777 [Westerdykella ornata]
MSGGPQKDTHPSRPRNQDGSLELARFSTDPNYDIANYDRDSGPTESTNRKEERVDDREKGFGSCPSKGIDDTGDCLQRIRALLHGDSDPSSPGDDFNGRGDIFNGGDDDHGPDFAAQLEQLLQKALEEISAGEHERRATLLQMQDTFRNFRDAYDTMQRASHERSNTVLELGIHLAGKGLVYTGERCDIEAHHRRSILKKELAIQTLHDMAKQDRQMLIDKQRECEELWRDKEALARLYNGVCRETSGTAIKRSANTASLSSNELQPDSKRQKRIVQCIECYRNDIDCDGKEFCAPCREKGVPCERSRCPHFGLGKCHRPRCTMAHEGDGFAPESICEITVALGKSVGLGTKCTKLFQGCTHTALTKQNEGFSVPRQTLKVRTKTIPLFNQDVVDKGATSPVQNLRVDCEDVHLLTVDVGIRDRYSSPIPLIGYIGNERLSIIKIIQEHLKFSEYFSFQVYWTVSLRTAQV